MRDFADLYICDYPDYKKTKVHFVGSVAYIFSKELNEVAKEKGFTVGKIIKQPIDDLIIVIVNEIVLIETLFQNKLKFRYIKIFLLIDIFIFTTETQRVHRATRRTFVKRITPYSFKIN